ncbi:MAG: GNAT family N-acetyltransferase [Planctomycetes bacterium]|nr:GNAT family N-acetyltransferase [Planctomycetota bacterium]
MPLIFEIREYEGSPAELSDFMFTHWSATYRGKMVVPRWTADYLRWQLRMDDPSFRRHIVVAYKGTQLAGVLAHVPLEIHLIGQRFRASQQSWLTVAQEFRRQGVGQAMADRSVAIHRERGCAFHVGYTYFGHKISLGPKFVRDTQSKHVNSIRNAGFWVRVLDPAKSAAWNINPWEAWATRLATPLFPRLGRPTNTALTIRPAEPRDLDTCLALVNRETSQCDLRIAWDADSMSRQLGLQGYSHALVAEEGGQVRGLITFHILPMTGHFEAPVGIIDIVGVSELSKTARNAVVDAALLSLQELGAIVALKLRVGDYPPGLFLRLGWMIRPPDSHVVVDWISVPRPAHEFSRLHLLWR